MKRVFSSFLILLLLAIGVAVEGPACASMAKGPPACCQDCLLGMMAKRGDPSCCRQGLEKGNAILQQPVKKLSPIITTSPIKNEWVVFTVSPIFSSSPEENSIYLIEEHLLL